MRILSFLLSLFIFFSCIKEPPAPVSEKKVISFYTDYFIYSQKLKLGSNIKEPQSAADITNYVLRKNKLTHKDLKKINAYYNLNPKAFDSILIKTSERVDSIFGKKKPKKEKVKK